MCKLLKIVPSIICVGLLLTACDLEEIDSVSEEVQFNHHISIPIGPKILTINKPAVADTSSYPGPYGTFYYNNLPYTNNSLIFNVTKSAEFDFDPQTSKAAWLKRLDLIVFIENNFASQTSSQLYLVDANGTIVDTAVPDGRIEVNAATVNQAGEITAPGQSSLTITYEGERLEKLKQTKSIYYNGIIITRTNNLQPLYLSEKNYLKINIAIRAQLEYNANEINK